MPSANVVAEDTVVCLLADGNERRYRIEKDRHEFFEDERLDPKSDLALLLIGKQPNDKINLQENRIAAKPVEVRWIKSVYLDAFHRSLEQFNERFPRAVGLQKFKFDPDSADPLAEMRAITKARAEASRSILKEYESRSLPFAFVAALVGRDSLDAWASLPRVGVEFQVSRGSFPERKEALQIIKQHGRKGCVLDAITLSVLRRLGLEKVVDSVCGPIHTSQSVIDLLASRALEAKHDIGKKQGYITWHENQLLMEEFSEETMQKIAEERAKEVLWARTVTTIAAAMPKKDLSPDARSIIDKVGHVACDPAIAASGNDFLLLTEDMGFRSWAAATFGVAAIWLQPVLMAARAEGTLTDEQYTEAINTLALSGHVYISLDSGCLLHQARKGNFTITNELSRLIGKIGGPTADLNTNTRVLSNFIDALWQESVEHLKVKRIASEGFAAITSGHEDDQRSIIALVLKQIQRNKATMNDHALAWLIGHSIGLPYFNDLLKMQHNRFNRW